MVTCFYGAGATDIDKLLRTANDNLTHASITNGDFFRFHGL
jgi:hypothetical protein